MSPFAIGILEDDDIVSETLAGVIASAGDLRLAFRARTVGEALAALSAAAPDLCLVDLNLPDGNGIDFIAALKSAGDARALVLTVFGDRTTVVRALKGGADGYLLKSATRAEILKSVRQVLDGFTPVSPQVATYLLELLRPSAQKRKDAADLTPREVEILNFFSRGLTYEETGAALGLTKNTVRDFVKKIYAKMSVNSRSEAVFEAQSLGLIKRD
jgi:DNA-binding NarL/FixJ family response regulator